MILPIWDEDLQQWITPRDKRNSTDPDPQDSKDEVYCGYCNDVGLDPNSPPLCPVPCPRCSTSNDLKPKTL